MSREIEVKAAGIVGNCGHIWGADEGDECARCALQSDRRYIRQLEADLIKNDGAQQQLAALRGKRDRLTPEDVDRWERAAIDLDCIQALLMEAEVPFFDGEILTVVGRVRWLVERWQEAGSQSLRAGMLAALRVETIRRLLEVYDGLKAEPREALTPPLEAVCLLRSEETDR